MGAEDSVQAIKVKLELENLKEIQEQMTKAWTLGNTIDKKGRAGDVDELNGFFKFYNEVRNRFRGIPGETTSENTKAALKMTGDAANASNKAADDLMKIMKTGLGIIEDIHARIKSASPLLQSVESLFNLAVQLFFMPLGNKLATVMIPAVIDLVDNVTEMWSRFEGMDLGGMLNEMITYGAEIFGKFFVNLGEELAKQSGLAGAIGKTLVGLGDFIENHLADLLEIVADVLNLIMNNLGTLIVAFFEYKTLSLALQATQTAAALAGPLAPIAGLLAFTGVEIGANAVASEYGLFDMANSMNTGKRAAAGAYVGAVEGGRTITVGEGGEGEFILPETKLQGMMASVSDRMVDVAQTQPTQTTEKEPEPQVINNYFNINGYTDSQLKDIIRDTVNEQVSQSRLRSGF